MQNTKVQNPLDEAIQKRVREERRAHNDDDVLSRSYQLKNRFRHIWHYPSRQRMEHKLLSYLDQMQGQKVLDYGCGYGAMSLYMLQRGAEVCGIDISASYVKYAKERCCEAASDKSKYTFCVMDAHRIAFMDDTFDLVIGLGILHHLEINVAIKEIHRVLKPNGRVLLREPLADNPILRLFRKLTPSARTTDEYPLTGKDVSALTSSPDWKADMHYCGIIEAPIAVITSLCIPSKEDNFILRAADHIEQKLHAQSFLSSWNQYVLLDLVKMPSEQKNPRSQ